MKCVCIARHQRILGKGLRPRWIEVGEVLDFDELPENHFVSDEDYTIDFETASEKELLSGNFELAALKTFIEEKYEEKAGNRGLEKTVQLLLDCRFRVSDMAKASGVARESKVSEVV